MWTNKHEKALLCYRISGNFKNSKWYYSIARQAGSLFFRWIASGIGQKMHCPSVQDPSKWRGREIRWTVKHFIPHIPTIFLILRLFRLVVYAVSPGVSTCAIKIIKPCIRTTKHKRANFRKTKSSCYTVFVVCSYLCLCWGLCRKGSIENLYEQRKILGYKNTVG